MPRDFSERRTVSKVKRQPPTTQAEAMTKLLAGVVALNECTPEATMDAKGADAQKLIAAGERLEEVTEKLKRLQSDLREGQSVSPTIFRARLIVRLGGIITFAEKSG